MTGALIGVVLAAAGVAIVFAVGDQHGARRERRKAEADRARAVAYRRRSIP